MSKKDTLQEVLEIVRFLKDNAATKKELKKELSGAKSELRIEMREMKSEIEGKMMEMKSELEEKMSEMKSDVIEHIDGLASQQKTFDVELSALKNKSSRLEKNQKHIGKTLHIEFPE